MKLTAYPLSAVAAFTVPTVVAEPEALPAVPVPRLVMELAMKMAKASIDACRQQGVNIATTVVDRSGHPQWVSTTLSRLRYRGVK